MGTVLSSCPLPTAFFEEQDSRKLGAHFEENGYVLNCLRPVPKQRTQINARRVYREEHHKRLSFFSPINVVKATDTSSVKSLAWRLLPCF